MKTGVLRLEDMSKKIRNTLNDLSGAEWRIFTKSWFVLTPPARIMKNGHPATFPDELAEQFIRFFTKEGQWVLDPFGGMASTLVAAKRLNRNSVGVELYNHFAEQGRARLAEVEGPAQAFFLQGDSRFLKDILCDNDIPEIDFCLSSPPYWSQLSRSSERQKERLKKGLRTSYGDDDADIGRIDDYNQFLLEQEHIFDSVYSVMRKQAYLVVITNNVYKEGKLWPLAFDTFKTLSKKWAPKDEKIWCQDYKSLKPFGMFNSYIGNRSHHYCLVFRKE
jgi:DNA modification methylase